MSVTDNNFLTYIFVTATLDATGQRWVASLSNYNSSIKYRSGKNKSDAGDLSRIGDSVPEKVIFPEVLKAVCQSATVSVEQYPFFECIAITDTTDGTEEISENLFGTFALCPKDWRKAQKDDPTLRSTISGLRQVSWFQLREPRTTLL